MSTRLTFVALLSLALAAGCQKNENTAITAPSSDQPGYAARYPDQLAKVRGRYSEQEGRARRAMGTFAQFPGELDKPSWADVLKVYEAADAAGKSAEYVERLHESNAVADFFTEEKEEINKKVGGAAQYTAKQKGCTVDLYGTTTTALEKSVEKQLEKRLRERNEAHRYIDDHEDSIGKPNREKLEKQADEISLTSYLVKVAGEETKRELTELVAEAEDVKSTLERTITESKEAAADAKRSDNEKKKAQTRLEAAEKAKGRIEQETQEAQKLLEEIDKRNQALKDEYDKAFEDLKKKTEEKAASEKPAAS
ncbi:MAG: hypothetical protein HS104_15935 [Polyangiaceae bacterium]|nr:hypothetical protein [Polyangiaceae bacterium]MBK9000235.1 hypothetical protein [Myxococcales bacterium]MCE7890842.1 hypothetical protein [Sorangiineae bacterium PRO1]